MRAFPIAEAGNVGLSRDVLKYASESFSFASKPRRNGHGTSPMRFACSIHLHTPYAAIALIPPTTNPRRESRRTSRATAASFSAIRIAGSGAGGSSSAGSAGAASAAGSSSISLMRHLAHFVADDHRPEIVPAGLDHLRHMNDEEDDVTDGKPEVEEARHLISAEQKREPRELNRLVDRQPGEEGTEAHEDDGGVGDLLRPVELSWQRRFLPKMEVMQRDLDGFLE